MNELNRQNYTDASSQRKKIKILHFNECMMFLKGKAGKSEEKVHLKLKHPGKEQ